MTGFGRRRRAPLSRPRAPRPTEIGRFLDALFPDAPDGLIEIRGFAPTDGDPPRLRRFASTVEEAAVAAAHGTRRGLNVVVGVATRRDATSGGKANLASAFAIWADLDPDAGEIAAELEARLAAFEPPPSAVVRSGAGAHAYWLLAESFFLDDAGAAERFEAALKGLADALGADLAATDASRMMRVAGTWNYPTPRKRARGRDAAPATIARLDADAFYPFDAFAPFEARGRRRARAARVVAYSTADWDGELPGPVADLAAGEDAALHRLLTNPAGRIRRHADENRVDWEVARRLAWRGVPGAAIEHALRWRRTRFGTDKRKGDGYFTRTVEKALGAVAAERAALRVRAGERACGGG